MWVTGLGGAGQQLHGAERSFLGAILVVDPVVAGELAQVFAQELIILGIEDTHMQSIPLDFDLSADPAWR